MLIRTVSDSEIDVEEKINWLVDDPELTWFPFACFSKDEDGSDESNEKILGKNHDGKGDRRSRILSARDDRFIINCIGRICVKENKEQKATWGTGTVYKFDKNTKMCYVLTCAHNVFEKDEESHKIREVPIKEFYRVETLPVTESWKERTNNNSDSKHKYRDSNLSSFSIASTTRSRSTSSTITRSSHHSKGMSISKNNSYYNSISNRKLSDDKRQNQRSGSIIPDRSDPDDNNPFKFCFHVGKYRIIEAVYFNQYSSHATSKEFFPDLAIVKFQDDGFYEKLFKEKKCSFEEIKLCSCKNIQSNDNNNICFELYGFPFTKKTETESKVVNGGMYGMKATVPDCQNSNVELLNNNSSDSFNTCNNDKKSQDSNQFVRLNEDDEKWFYNAIDTEPGQSGSALFIQTGINRGGVHWVDYNIVGVHLGGNKKSRKNWAFALKNDKIKWIKGWKGDTGTIGAVSENMSAESPENHTDSPETPSFTHQDTRSQDTRSQDTRFEDAHKQVFTQNQNCLFKNLCCCCNR